ncbi:MAG: hypothetical protein U0V74_00945 [Chitinophagales bacterium]
MDTKNRQALLWGSLAIAFLVCFGWWQFKKAESAIDQFRKIDQQITASDSLLKANNQDILTSVAANPQADTVHRLVMDYCNYIDSLHEKLISKAGGIDENGNIANMGDIDIATQLLAEGPEGKLLYQKLQTLRTTLYRISPQNKPALESLLNSEIHTDNQEEKLDWLHLSFYHIPVTAAVTILSKFRSDALAAEKIVLKDIK